MAIRVVIADDHALLREGVRALLGLSGDIEVAGEASDGQEAIEACKRDPALAYGLNTHEGRVTYQAVAEALGLEYRPAW